MSLFTVYDTWQPITDAWAAGRMQAHDGHVGFSQGAFPGGYAAPLYPTMQACARNNLRIVRLAGFEYRDFYANAAPWRTPQVWFDETMKAVGDEWDKVTRTCIDYEIADPPNFIQDADMHAFIALLQTLGHPVDGYSGTWFLDVQELALRRPTPAWEMDGDWYADYNARQEIVTPAKVLCLPVVGHQHTGSVMVDGVSCDISVYDDSVIPAPPAQPAATQEDDMVIQFEGNGSVYSTNGSTNQHVDNVAMLAQLPPAKVLKKGSPEYDLFAGLPTTFTELPQEMR